MGRFNSGGRQKAEDVSESFYKERRAAVSIQRAGWPALHASGGLRAGSTPAAGKQFLHYIGPGGGRLREIGDGFPNAGLVMSIIFSRTGGNRSNEKD